VSSNGARGFAPLTELHDAVIAAALEARGEGGAGAAAEPRLERSKRADQGDYSTNAAMLLAPVLGAPPREIAGRIADSLTASLPDAIARLEIAGPGFLNLFMSDAWLRDTLEAVLRAGDRFGAGGADPVERILVEFVSANPTAELVVASGRHAAYGDALSRILEHHGHAVAREYYFNDAGSQIRLFGESVRARALAEPIPEGGYQGDYVAALASEVDGAGDPAVSIDVVAGRAVEILLARIKRTLERYGVHFDRFFSERELHSGSPNEIEKAIALLAEAGHLYRSEGALWLRTTTFGDDKDRVLERSGGEPTYFAADVAYMLNKRERGFNRQLLPVGADHHGYVARLKAAWEAFGNDPELLEPLILQFVHLVEGEERAAMSKRRGEFVTLDDLLDEIGVDATRFFMLQRSHDRTVDLDLELARRQDKENPVYYVQYAHARISTMLSRLEPGRIDSALERATGWGNSELHPSERDLVMKLAAFPGEVAEAAERRAPHRIAGYALELAQDFTAFYRDCRVVGATPEAVESLRTALSAASQRALALSLGLLGVSAPTSM
jgi:arginyl-tRNA synthetase